MKVDTQHDAYKAALDNWCKCRHVSEGQVKEQKTKYLPPLGGHEGGLDPEYLAYVQRAYFYNATGRTIDALTGMVFHKDPDIVTPASMDTFVEDVTLSGCSLVELSNEVLEELLRVGRYGVLVDFEGSDEGLTVFQAESANRRPKFVSYKAENIINWRYGYVGGKYQLTLVVLEETYEKPKGGDLFQTETITRYRVLKLEGAYSQDVWEKSDGKFVMVSTVTPTISSKPFEYIPFRIFAPDNSLTVEQPPLLDLVEANLAHYRTSADYEHGVHMTGLPMVFGRGFSLDEGESLPIGSAAAYCRSESDADLKFLEFEGKGLEAIEKNMNRKEAHMASLGARLLQESPRQVETASAVHTKQQGENSVLASLAKVSSKGLTWCLKIAAEWMRVSDEVSIDLPTDYIPDSVDSNTLNALLKAKQAGSLSKESFIYNLQRGGYLPDDKSIEDEMNDTEEEDLPPVAPLIEPVAIGNQ